MAIKTSIARWVAGTALSVVASWSVSALAAAPAVPATLTQQGRILDKDGAPVSSKVAITFTVYNHPTKAAAANTLWTETQNISLDDGYFSAQLGNTTAFPDGLFDGSVLYLGVTVGSDDEMTPRQAITSVPYAFVAGAAATAAVAASAPFTGLTGIPAACPDGQYLKGFTAAGAATCAALPALVCHTVTAAAKSGTSNFVGCDTGVITGGGCYSDSTAAPLRAAYIVPPCTGLCLNCLSFGTACVNDYLCETTATANVTAYARCCTVQ